MIYVEYSQYKRKLREAQAKYDAILEEQEQLFSITQPAVVEYEKIRSAGGVQKNRFDQYLILKEEKQIDKRLAEMRSILDSRKRLLEEKTEELRQSNEIHDKVFRYRYIDRMRISRIAGRVGYSEIQVYRILRKIQSTLKDDSK